MPSKNTDRTLGDSPTGWHIVFFGTPEFAVPSLERLITAGEKIVGVVCQPDKPAGRGRRTTGPPVKQLAKKLGLPVAQPEKVRNNPEFVAQLQTWSPDLIVVVAYGKILPREVLSIPPQGCINVHASLLPLYRGAAPIQWALMRGETETGISIMLMNEEMDAGPVLLQCRTEIGEEETFGELQQRLAKLGAECLLKALRLWHAGLLEPQPQDPTRVTFAPLIDKSMGKINWQLSANEIARLVRGLSPVPCAYFLWKGQRVKVYRARAYAREGDSTRPGTILRAEPRLEVSCGTGSLELVEIQLEGRRRGAGSEVARGVRWKPGQSLN